MNIVKQIVQRFLFAAFSFATLVFIQCICVTFPAQALTLSFSVDNDGIFLTDREYTSGLFVRLGNKDGNYGYSGEIGSQIWTPHDITNASPQPEERPYAGLLYLKGRMHYQTSELALKGAAMLGAIGADSYAEDIQSFGHRIISSPTPRGWDYQIYDQKVFQLELEAHHLMHRTIHKKNETSLFTRIQLGNFQPEIAIGGSLRIGLDLENSFGSVSLTSNNNIDPDLLETSQSGFFLYTMIEARYRGGDVTIEGDKPAVFHNLSIKKEQAAFSTGLVYYKNHWGVGGSFIWQSRSYNALNARDHNFANILFFHRF